ncbi:MAG: metallophosphoesterase [Patescibacteria group bacterium]
MKIAIISDTHGNIANFKKIASWLNKNNISLILHCGDIGNPESLRESLADFEGELCGVFGNMDRDFKILIAEYNKIPNAKISEIILETKIENKNIAITHFPNEAKELAKTGKYEIVFYGHTHKPWEEKIGNCKMINPGELAGQFNKPTFAVYDTDTDESELKILEKI